MTKDEVEIIVDDLHTKANQDIKNKSLGEYMSVFSEDLRYTQVNGKTINKKKLTEDQRKFWSRIIELNSKVERLDCHYDGDLFTETLTQIATVSIRVFIFFRKNVVLQHQALKL